MSTADTWIKRTTAVAVLIVAAVGLRLVRSRS